LTIREAGYCREKAALRLAETFTPGEDISKFRNRSSLSRKNSLSTVIRLRVFVSVRNFAVGQISLWPTQSGQIKLRPMQFLRIAAATFRSPACGPKSRKLADSVKQSPLDVCN
jgi:hypothetical protein